jgi:hypothetical protein
MYQWLHQLVQLTQHCRAATCKSTAAIRRNDNAGLLKVIKVYQYSFWFHQRVNDNKPHLSFRQLAQHEVCRCLHDTIRTMSCNNRAPQSGCRSSSHHKRIVSMQYNPPGTDKQAANGHNVAVTNQNPPGLAASWTSMRRAGAFTS